MADDKEALDKGFKALKEKEAAAKEAYEKKFNALKEKEAQAKKIIEDKQNEIKKKEAEIKEREKALNDVKDSENVPKSAELQNQEIELEVARRVRETMTATATEKDTDDINDPDYDDAEAIKELAAAAPKDAAKPDPLLKFPTSCCGKNFKTDLGLNAHRFSNKKCPKGARFIPVPTRKRNVR